ncbi:hypothetical protein [Goodfellowiella coeruleoviolacea]|uniref:hypothetical protein n=1 Tax=Goodfellowiella coeruleoviolacea TaxID=334858 RepID=UPI0020A3987F|nr:hypothetical protein [Goodfellowiella coeruleoviolacea]
MSDVADLRAQLLGMVEIFPTAVVEGQGKKAEAAAVELSDVLRSTGDEDVELAPPLVARASEELGEILELLVAAEQCVNGYLDIL